MRIRLTMIVVSLGAIAVGVCALAAARMPRSSDNALQARFVAHRADFEKLRVMANEDRHLIRIAPDFTWLDTDGSWPRKNVGISEQRWDVYRQIFRSVGSSGGILNYTNPTLIKFPIISRGMVPSGAAKGFAYSSVPLRPVLKSLDETLPDEYWNGPDRSHVIAYKPLEDHWYIYYEQW